MIDAYEADILLWSEHQGSLLKRLADGERVNDQVDWPNVIEEVESVGREQLHAVESLLLQALTHLLKSVAWPSSRDAPVWQADARQFRRQARRRFTNSMRQRLDLPGIYADALAGLPETLGGRPGLLVPDVCPITLDELLETIDSQPVLPVPEVCPTLDELLKRATPTTTSQAIVPNGHRTGHKENEKRANSEESAIQVPRIFTQREPITTEPKKATWNERDMRRAGWFCVAALAALMVSGSAWLLNGRPLSPAWGFVLWTEVTTFLLVFAVNMFLDWLGIGRETEKANRTRLT